MKRTPIALACLLLFGLAAPAAAEDVKILMINCKPWKVWVKKGDPPSPVKLATDERGLIVTMPKGEGRLRAPLSSEKFHGVFAGRVPAIVEVDVEHLGGPKMVMALSLKDGAPGHVGLGHRDVPPGKTTTVRWRYPEDINGWFNGREEGQLGKGPLRLFALSALRFTAEETVRIRISEVRILPTE